MQNAGGNGSPNASNVSSAASGDLISLAARKPLASSGIRNTIVASTGNPSKPSQISFDRMELNAILRVYGFRVADGDWRDYAIDHLKDRAMFSIYRRASESPLFTVEKNPKLAKKQGAYSVRNQNGVILKRGHDISQVLKVFDRKLSVVI
ncbi:MAG: DUF2794 domain-containing protein [Pseudomonadota bacterium]